MSDARQEVTAQGASMLLHVVKLQDELNEKTTENWVKAGQDWNSAILAEAGEAMESLDYKWWKSTAADMENFKVEVIDLLHFLISRMLDDAANIPPCDNPKVTIVEQELVANSLMRAYNASDSFLATGSYEDLLKTFTGEVLVLPEVNVMTTAKLMAIFRKLDMSIDDIFASYISKNLLNGYRQERGYADEDIEYVKNFPDGREDNMVFKEVVESLSHIEFKSLSDLRDAAFVAMDAQVLLLSK